MFKDSLIHAKLSFLLLLVVLGCSCTSHAEKELESILSSDGSVLRSPATGKVYLVSGGQRHYLPNPATAEALGVICLLRTEDDPLIDEIPLGKDLGPLQTKVVQNSRTKEAFLLEAGHRRYIPDPDTLSALNLSSQLRSIEEQSIDLIPVGPPLAHMGRTP